jgi:hypothetical protein
MNFKVFTGVLVVVLLVLGSVTSHPNKQQTLVLYALGKIMSDPEYLNLSGYQQLEVLELFFKPLIEAYEKKNNKSPKKMTFYWRIKRQI